MGCPIRKSADQSFFAAPHGLSQRSTSFIASQRQGIHRMPLRHLIVLIINAHSRDPTEGPGAHIDRKTSLLRDRPDSARGQASASTTPLRTIVVVTQSLRTMPQPMSATAPGVRELHSTSAEQQTRSDLLFTMSDNTRPPHEAEAREPSFTSGRAAIKRPLTHQGRHYAHTFWESNHE